MKLTNVSAAVAVLLSCSTSAQDAASLPSWMMDSVTAAAPLSEWKVSGGELKVLFNPDLMADLKIVVEAEGSFNRNELRGFSMRVSESDTLRYDAPNGTLENFTTGLLRGQGRFSFKFADKEKVFESLSVRPKAGTPRDLEVLDDAGVVWFVADHLHFELLDNNTRLSLRNMDLRLTAAAAEWLGDSSLEGINIGSLDFTAMVQRIGLIRSPAACGDPNWHNKLIDPNDPTGPRYQADVLLSTISSLDYKRCQGTCDGPNGASDGQFIMAPGATLRNSDTNTTADVPWHSKFSGQFAPHNNDQHPYLIFNVYRVEKSTGKLEHIARSGAKHAFLTINTGCATYNCGDNHVLWRQCADVYSSGNNDSTGDLGPRSEIIPSKGIWARCGSIYDPGCSGSLTGGGGTNTSNRMLIKESAVTDTTNFDYFYDSWYVIRDDVNIYNGMGFKKFTPSFVSGTWRSTAESAFTTGAFIDTWATAAPAPQSSMVREIVTPNGRMKFGVRVTQVGNQLTYQYALQNFDYTVATTEQVGSNPSNVRMLSQSAIRSVDFGAAPLGLITANITDGNDSKQDWTRAAGRLKFSAPSAADELSWGNIMSFTVRINGTAATRTQASSIQIGGVDGSEIFSVETLVPVNDPDVLSADGFEDTGR
jgi:hypothetical protein